MASIKLKILNILPKPVVNNLINFKNNFKSLLSLNKIRSVKKHFINSVKTPEYLGFSELEYYQRKYKPKSRIKYDLDSNKLRANIRISRMMSLLKKNDGNIKDILEVGCRDGFSCNELQKMGKNTTGIDLFDKNFNDLPVKNGVKLIKMDAEKLAFSNNSFDLVFSFNSFEHFLNPEKVLKEMIKVVKKAGYIFLSFGPLYMSPFGLHLSKSINVPYCQHLFKVNILKKLCDEGKALREFYKSQLNMWHIQDYDNLWKKYNTDLSIIYYKKFKKTKYLDLIKNYPSCFRSKTDNFDDLITESILILLKKK